MSPGLANRRSPEVMTPGSSVCQASQRGPSIIRPSSDESYLDELPGWATTAERAYLRRLPTEQRRVLDAYVDWLTPAAEWTTFATFTWPDRYADEHRGLYGPRGAARWVERFMGWTGYDGSLVIAPEGHKWRDVHHAHMLAERVDWRTMLGRYTGEVGSSYGLDICRASRGALAYACKYALKTGLSEHVVLRLADSGMVPR